MQQPAPYSQRMPPPVAYIAVVYASAAMRAKISDSDHGHLTFDEVREAVELCTVEDSWWDDHPDRGWRLIVLGTTGQGRNLTVVLYPVDEGDGTWNLGTAYLRENT